MDLKLYASLNYVTWLIVNIKINIEKYFKRYNLRGLVAEKKTEQF